MSSQSIYYNVSIPTLLCALKDLLKQTKVAYIDKIYGIHRQQVNRLATTETGLGRAASLDPTGTAPRRRRREGTKRRRYRRLPGVVATSRLSPARISDVTGRIPARRTPPVSRVPVSPPLGFPVDPESALKDLLKQVIHQIQLCAKYRSAPDPCGSGAAVWAHSAVGRPKTLARGARLGSSAIASSRAKIANWRVYLTAVARVHTASLSLRGSPARTALAILLPRTAWLDMKPTRFRSFVADVDCSHSVCFWKSNAMAISHFSRFPSSSSRIWALVLNG